ncbi:MAG: RNA polymerase sigma factor region1.1 domain-containing protein, partial [Spirochaetota bacterium]
MSKGDLVLENITEVKKLIELGKANNEITYDEINDILPDKLLNSEKIDDIFILLNQLGIEVVEDSTRKAAPEVAVKKKASTTRKAASANEDTSHVDDPIRLYLKEIGKVSLLSGEQEVDLAKRIEDGEILIEKAVITSTLLINELIKNHSKVISGKIKLTDILKINRLYYFSSIDLTGLENKYTTKMKIIIEEDSKIIKLQNKLKRYDNTSPEFDKINEDIKKAQAKIRQAVEELEISEDEISKISNKIQSMVKRIDETNKFFSEIEERYNKDIKELKH